MRKWECGSGNGKEGGRVKVECGRVTEKDEPPLPCIVRWVGVNMGILI